MSQHYNRTAKGTREKQRETRDTSCKGAADRPLDTSVDTMCSSARMHDEDPQRGTGVDVKGVSSAAIAAMSDQRFP